MGAQVYEQVEWASSLVSEFAAVGVVADVSMERVVEVDRLRLDNRPVQTLHLLRFAVAVERTEVDRRKAVEDNNVPSCSDGASSYAYDH